MLEIKAELLAGTIRASSSDPLTGARDHRFAEWPPAPSRLFSALVAGGGTGEHNRIGSSDQELRELESAAPPTLLADSHDDVEVISIIPRFVVVDERANSRVQNYPARKAQEVRVGERCVPKNPEVSYRWADLELSEQDLLALRKRAARVAYLGAADSPVRLSVRATQTQSSDQEAQDSRVEWLPVRNAGGSYSSQAVQLGVPNPGFLDLLDRNYQAFRDGSAPHGSSMYRQKVAYEPQVESTDNHANHVSESVFVSFNRSVGARRVLDVAEALRGAVMNSYDQLFSDLPQELHGHIEGSQYQAVRFIPLPNAGFEWSNSKIHGAAICIPRSVEPGIAEQIKIAVARISELNLVGGDQLKVTLRDSTRPRPWATHPRRWEKPATEFATVFPAVYERFEKKRTPDLEIVARWCENAGLPKPIAAQISRSSYLSGVPKFESREVWRDRSTRKYPFAHVKVTFETPVSGPVAIGRGRSFGLGLLVPVVKPKQKTEEETKEQQTEEVTS